MPHSLPSGASGPMPKRTERCSIEIASPEAGGRALLLRAAERLRLSARGYHRVLRVARTLADLEGSPDVGRRHVAEALSYRRLSESAPRA